MKILLAKTQLQAQPHPFVPVVAMDCPSSRERGYDFNRAHWIALLRAMGDEFVERHFSPEAAGKRRRAGTDRPAVNRRSSGSDLRDAAQSYLMTRRTRVLLLDEAHHMTRVRGSRLVEEHLEEIKDFGTRTGIKQVLLGTEQLRDLLRGNAQLARRTREIFYYPYAYKSPDLQSFNQILGQLCMSLPLRNLDLDSVECHFDYLFERSAGCVGLLKLWLLEALNRVLRAGRERLLFGDLQATAMDENRLEVIAKGIVAFEEFARPSASMSQVRSMLGMPVEAASAPPARTVSRRRKRPRPGVRNPHRDPVPAQAP